MTLTNYLVPGVGRALTLVNFCFQRILRFDSDCRYQKHFTSRVVNSEGLRFLGQDTAQRRSLAVSGGCYINSAGGVSIGQGTIWAPNICILAQEHDRNDIAVNVDTAPTTIGENCWIGFGAVIMPRVVIGPNTIIGANAVVTRSFPDGNVTLVGCPARPLVRTKTSEE